jgi:hypothetical protein
MGKVLSFDERWDAVFREQAWTDLSKACDFCNEEQYLEAEWIIQEWIPIAIRVWRSFKRSKAIQHSALITLNGFLELRKQFESEIEIALHAVACEANCAAN